ncbi:signal-induced proliferation-associated 1-like protein 2 [Leucoraja erinacea]|uniref:signal-induced proliferation-associated 1-like protein 2 n=1 Tax=Leucoraja erinaceus TaxID=7782 RepID=UPI002455282D|nr:signal-induced proliferation-associated 1-like protein 2 [Leucoraja erinacea]XP_055520753.1 signal-induced proliferation-associated 1-like protein 2 [Leucoraja erinacea]
MQSDDFFFRKFKRSNPRPLLTAVTFEPKAARPAPEPVGTTVRARILEWPPQKEMPEGQGGAPSSSQPAAEGLGPEEEVVEVAEEEEGEGRSAGPTRGPAPIQRSNSEAAIAESAASPAATGAALHREYGSASSVERPRGPEGEGEREGEGAESPAAPRFHDPYLLLGLPETPGPIVQAQAQAQPLACRRALKAEGPRSPGPDEPRSGPPWRRPRSLAHYDVQSLLFDPQRAASSRDSAGRRKNMVTGASAASQAPGPSKAQEPPDGEGEGEGEGAGEGAALVLSCPHFRNEVGGEGERQRSSQCPNAAVSVLEEPRESQLTRTGVYFIEHADLGANYYRKYFSGKEHQNFFGIDEGLGPVAVSLRREEKDKDSGSSSQYNYRIIVRTTELRTLRASILEDAFPSSARHGPQRGLPPKKLLEYVVPGLNTQCLRLASSSPKVPEMLLKLDEQGLTFQRKVGVMYCKAGQSTEEEMYNNEIAGPAFDEFLNLLGQRVKLKGFEKYRAQLDNKTDSTGTHSLYTTYQEYEIMFHVSTMLPYTANNSQQLLRKRHIGNDIVTIVFQEPGAGPFTPKTIRSHFQHVFLVVQVHNPCTEQVSYSVAITCSKDIPEFGPFFPKEAAFSGTPTFREFLLAKVVNGENGAEKSEKFHAMATRTRQEYLKELADNHVTTATVDSSSSSKLAAIISLPTKRKERPRGGRAPELHSAGALVWPVAADWTGAPGEADAVLGISNEFVVVLDPRRQRVVSNCSCRDVIGWTLSRGKRVVIYYEQGEFVDVTTLDNQPDDFTEIVHRLEMVTTGCVTEDLVLRRNSVHHLGFQVNGDGIVTQVEENGYAQMTGLKLFSRLVRICEIPMVTMSYSKRTEILRKADHVRITIIPPDSKGKPRMSFSELYRKSIEETERKCERVSDLGLAAPCLLLSRMSSLQETRSTGPHGQQSPTVRSCSLEMRVTQGQRNERDPCSRPLKTSTPDLILAINSQCPMSPGRLGFNAKDGQVSAPRCSAPEEGRPSDLSACGPGPWHALGGATPISSLTAGPSQSMTSGANLHDIVASDASNMQWESLTDIALYCENLVHSFSLEEEKAAEESSDVDGQREENQSSAPPTALTEKVFQLETVVKQLNEKLQQEQEDKAQLTTEMEQLRQTNQRLHQESQTTVCRLLRVTELLIHNGNSKAPNLHN